MTEYPTASAKYLKPSSRVLLPDPGGPVIRRNRVHAFKTR